MDKKENTKEVIIIGGDHYNTYGIVRSLGEEGIKSDVLILGCKSKDSFVLRSRYVEKGLGCLTHDDVIAFLKRNFDDNGKNVVICCSDEAEELVLTHYEELSTRLILPVCSNYKETTRLMNKDVITQLAKQHGIRVPETWQVISRHIPNRIIYPCITKPLTSIGGRKSDIVVCKNEGELRAVVEDEKRCADYVVQEYIEFEKEISILGAVLANGEVRLSGCIDKLRTCMIGTTSFGMMVDNSLLGDNLPKGCNSYYQNDKTVFESNYLNIDAFERIHLDPITGFYKCDSYYELTNSYVDDTAKKFLCTRPFYASNGDLPENTVIIVDSGYQWRSDCWGDHGSYSPRPNNVSNLVTMLDTAFWSGFRRRTFNVSSTSGGYVNQNYIDFFNHLRIYVPISDDIFLPDDREPTVTKTALGYAKLNSTASSMYGKTDIPVLITLHGDDNSHVKLEVDGNTINTPSGYTYNKDTGALTIPTSGNIGNTSFNFGTITGTVHPENGTITNISVSGNIRSYLTNNGSVTCSESWFDRCNYSTNAASQAVWQRWYMTGSWTANSGSGEWTTASNVYKLDNDYSMGLRIANNTYGKTRFNLRQDFNNGQGFTPKGISIWLYNPNGNIYGRFRIYLYVSPSSVEGDHVKPSGDYTQLYETTTGIGENEWKNIKLGTSIGKVYNVSFYFESSSSANTYVYLGHVSFY